MSSVKTMAAALEAYSPGAPDKKTQVFRQCSPMPEADFLRQCSPMPPNSASIQISLMEENSRKFSVSSSEGEQNTTFFVKVKNGIAHIVGDFDGRRVYIETRIGEVSSSTKASLEPLMLRLNERLAPVMAKVREVSAPARAKVLSVSSPIYAKIVDGVLHVQATIGNSTVFIQEKVSDTWSRTSAQISSSYSMAYKGVDARVRPLWLLTSSKLSAANGAILSASQPYWVRSRDGILYVQAAVGNTLVRIKVTSNERILMPALSAYATMNGVVNKYTAPILAKIVSVFDNAKGQLHQLLAPYAEKGQSIAKYARTMVNNMFVEVKVRTSTKLHSAQDFYSVCYIKFNKGYVYIHGLVGDKVLYVKVSIAEVTQHFSAKVVQLSSGAQSRVFAARNSVQDTALSAIRITKIKASVVSSKAGAIVTDKSVQVTAAGAVGGGATGLATGTVVGAVCGIVPAFFTFGLAIPVFATVGGATGLCTGTIAGGATAKSIHSHRDDIKNGLVDVMSKANGGKDFIINTASGGKEYVSKKAKGCSDFVGERTMMVKARLVGGTGGSAGDSD